jgi:hypothetical protein
MKVRFFVHCYFWPADGVIEDTYRLYRSAMLMDAPETTVREFNVFLLTALNSDFHENDYGQVDDVLIAIDKLERGEIETYETGGQDFAHSLTRDWVQFEHAVFGECTEWPLWRCTLAQYKAALQGYRRFLDIPKSLDSELIIDMPDCVPGSEYGIQPASSAQ